MTRHHVTIRKTVHRWFNLPWWEWKCRCGRGSQTRLWRTALDAASRHLKGAP